MASWFDRGVNQKRLAEEKAKRSKGFRFFLKKGETANIIFLEREPFAISEHMVRLEGSKRLHEYTCRRQIGEKCPLCAAGNVPRYTGFLTIIDTRSYEAKDGTTKTSTTKILPMTATVLEWWDGVLAANAEAGRETVGSMFKFHRTGKAGEPGIGGERLYIKNVKLEDYKFLSQKDGTMRIPEPVDFEKVMYPLSYEDLLIAAETMVREGEAGGEPSGGDSGGDSGWDTEAEGGDQDTSYT